MIELAIAPKGIIQQVVPLIGNEKALGLNLFEVSNQKKEAHLAKESGKLTLAGPLELAQGGIGLVGRLPISLNTKLSKDMFWGFVLAVIRVDDIFDLKAKEKFEELYTYEIWRKHPDTNQVQIILHSPKPLLENPVMYDFEVPNGTWTMSITPSKGWDDGGTAIYVREFLAFGFSLMLGFLAHLLIELKQAKGKLEKTVMETTDKSALLRKQLDILLDTIPDPIWLKDVQGSYLFCNRAFERLYGVPEHDIIGKNDYDFVTKTIADKFRVNDMMVIEQKKSCCNEVELHFKEDGYMGLFETIKTPFFNAKHELLGVLGIARDITKRRENEARIEKLEFFDPLTELPNKSLLNLRVEHDITICKRQHKPIAVLFLDFDHFKHVNDTLGHSVGDKLLVKMAKRLKSLLQQEDTISRQGGDEFVIILPNEDADGAAHMAQLLLDHVVEPLKVAEHELVLTASIGIAIYPEDGEDVETLFKAADAAMFQAKQNGRNNYRFFTADIHNRSSRVLLLENALRNAHLRGELSLHYQPQISLKTGEILGVEALLRWNHPTLGAISPAEFIPIAEESGQIILIGEWVLRTAVTRMKQWIESGIKPMSAAINLSAAQFHHPRLALMIQTILDEVQLAASYVELELTESITAQDPDKAIVTMNELHAKGILMSIDDFGTGYSSLSYLKKFKVNRLKIDQSFIRDISKDDDDKAIVITIIALAKSLGLHTIAEGVETQEQLEFLIEQGCEEAQGYYFSKPLCVEEIEKILRTASQ